MPFNKQMMSITTIFPTFTSVHQWKSHHQYWIDHGLTAFNKAVISDGRMRTRMGDYTIIFEEQGIFEEVCHWNIFHRENRLFGYTLMLEHGTQGAKDMWTRCRDRFRETSDGHVVLSEDDPHAYPWMLVWPFEGLPVAMPDIIEEGHLLEIGHVANVLAWTLIRTSWARNHAL